MKITTVSVSKNIKISQIHKENKKFIKSLEGIIDINIINYFLELNDILYEILKFSGFIIKMDYSFYYWFVPVSPEMFCFKTIRTFDEFLNNIPNKVISTVTLKENFHFLGVIVKITEHNINKFEKKKMEFEEENLNLLKKYVKKTIEIGVPERNEICIIPVSIFFHMLQTLIYFRKFKSFLALNTLY